ncbi:MAG TPA: TIGR03435 family protein [Terracidiphilus sp.]
MQWTLAGVVVAGVLLGAVPAKPTWAQATASESSSNKIEDTWQGTLHVPQHDLRIVLKVTRGDKGELKAVNYSIDQGGMPMNADSASFEDKTLKFGIDMIDGKYEGKMSADGKSIDGTWTQGPNPLPLLFERATPATAWAIPEPPPRLPPMDPKADPSFEVATIKPSKPDQPGKAFLVRGGQFTTINTTVADMLKFAYGVQDKQVIGGPDWVSTTKFDIEAKPDTPGSPSETQLRSMLQKLLADRLQLKFHRDERDLSAYVLSVGKTGQKMKQDTGDPNGLPALFFQGLGNLMVRNATMKEFTGLMQSAVLDRPVVDRTGLDGRWDFRLKWTPDESQFGGMGVKVPPPSDAADAPPPLFTAVQEELGLKLEATKTSVEVLVLDHIEQPSAN